MAVPDATHLLSLIRAERWEEVNDLLNENFFRILLTDLAGIRQAFDGLPPGWFEQYPRHVMSRAIVGTGGGAQPLTGGVDDHFTQWVERQSRPAVRDALAVLSGRLRLALASGGYERASLLVDEMIDMYRSSSEMAGFTDFLPPVQLQLGVVKLIIGDLTLAEELFGNALQWALDAPVVHPIAAAARSHTALVAALREDYALAHSRLPELSEAESPPEGTLAYQHETVNLYARMLISVGSGERAQADDMLELVRSRQTNYLWWVRLHVLSRYDIQWGSPRDALARIDRERRIHQGSLDPGLLVGRLLRSDLVGAYQLTGNLVAAERLLSTVDSSSAYPWELAAVARALLLRGAPERALQQVRVADAFGSTSAQLAVLRLVGEDMMANFTADGSVRKAIEAARTHQAWAALLESPPAIRHAIAARAEIPPQQGNEFPYRPRVQLSNREYEVLQQLRQYAAIADIATALHISPNTAKTHIRSLYQKLGVHSREQALLSAEAEKLR